MSYDELCDFDSCGLMGEGFFDIEYGIGIVCRRYPSEMLHQCGLAKFLRYAIIGNETMDPAAVWLLHVGGLQNAPKIKDSFVRGLFVERH